MPAPAHVPRELIFPRHVVMAHAEFVHCGVAGAVHNDGIAIGIAMIDVLFAGPQLAANAEPLLNPLRMSNVVPRRYLL